MRSTLIAFVAISAICGGGCESSANSTSAHDSSTLSLNATYALSGQEVVPFALEDQRGILVNDAKSGIHLIAGLSSDSLDNATGQAKKIYSGNYATLDWRALPNMPAHALIAAIDANTSAVDLLHFNPTRSSISKLASFPAQAADTEALCLSNLDGELHLFVVNERGQMQQHLVALDEQLANANLIDVRTINIGSNIADCTVIDSSSTLFAVEEELGIWQYDANPEGDSDRSLIAFESLGLENGGIEVESISNDGVTTVFAVSPDAQSMLAIDVTNNKAKQIVLENTSYLQAVNTQLFNNKLFIGGFNEDTGALSLSTLDWQQTPSVQTAVSNQLVANAETAPVNRFGDAADDPAIWVNRNAPEKSLIYGTDKKYGLNVYDLNGKLVQTIAAGKINNIDIRKNVTINGRVRDIAVASNRNYQSMTVFDIDPNNGVATLIANLPTDLNDVYGMCLFQHNSIDVFINDSDGRYRQYRLDLSASEVTHSLIESFEAPSQPEGCVVDDKSQQLFFGEEAKGVWQKDLRQANSKAVLIADADDFDEVEPDIEGMGLYQLYGKRYLVVSSQGNNRFAVYAIDDNNRFLGTFSIARNDATGIDGVSETDGLEVTSVALGSEYPKGLLVVQDGHNVFPLEPQNFKLVSGEQLARFIEQNL